jgi:hypothetical protein
MSDKYDLKRFFSDNKGVATICGDSKGDAVSVYYWLYDNGWEARKNPDYPVDSLKSSHVLILVGKVYDDSVEYCIDTALVNNVPIAKYNAGWGLSSHCVSPSFQFPKNGVPPMMAYALSEVFKVSNKCQAYSREEEQFNDAIYPLLRKGLPMHHLVLVLREYVDNMQASVIDLANEANSSIIDQKAESLKHISKHLTDAYTGLSEAGW